ncbi:hypothetical protein EVAR_39193_1 [Eumeta japonica]|uniref:Uncharacterized protein n=1 Tax=Eumeta variegata TaxID=151549 RepID=A0A4C1VQ98_EUMVA|nr:hypothetical protein EVAR_39193_1 [Eumeta japonica]
MKFTVQEVNDTERPAAGRCGARAGGSSVCRAAASGGRASQMSALGEGFANADGPARRPLVIPRPADGAAADAVAVRYLRRPGDNRRRARPPRHVALDKQLFNRAT